MFRVVRSFTHRRATFDRGVLYLQVSDPDLLGLGSAHTAVGHAESASMSEAEYGTRVTERRTWIGGTIKMVMTDSRWT